MSDEKKLPALQERPRRKGAASILNAAERKPQIPEESESQEPQARPGDAITFPSLSNIQSERNRISESERAETRYRSDAPHKVQLGVKVQEELKGRAKAAFKEAAYYEDVPSFEAFVARALEAEIRRIEIAHNGGERLEPREENLKRGRPAL